MSYVVLYPHPSISAKDRLTLLTIPQGAGGVERLDGLARVYPGLSADLEKATLWKASDLTVAEMEVDESGEKILQWIQGREGNPNAQEIQRYRPLGHYFQPEDTLAELGDWVNIVVLTPEISEDVDRYGDTDGNFRRKQARLAFSRSLAEISSPSDCVKQFSTVKRTVENPSGPRYGRPSDRFGPPTALFNKELAILKHDLEHLETLTPDLPTVDNAFRLVCSSTEIYVSEEARKSRVQEILRQLLPGGGKWQEKVADGAAKPDGIWLKGSLAYLIFELKNEQGMFGDPFLHTLIVYSKIVSQKNYAKFIPRSNLPIVLLTLAGNRLEVSTAIFTNAIYADKLLSIELMLGPHAQENVLRVARIFAAVSKCAAGLCDLYTNLVDSAPQVPGVEFPSPTLDPPGPSQEIRALEFFCKLDRTHGTRLITVDPDNERHAIYLARRSTGAAGNETVLVKFTAKYHEVAHRLLAAHDPPLAPALHSCTRVIGGMYMVVMEYLQDARPLYDFFPQSSTHLPPPDVDAVRRDLTKALDLLHEKGFVFGDLRQANVLYSSRDKGRVFLVDFDGVGEHGKDRYSPCLNTSLGLGMVRWQIMDKSYDRSSCDKVVSWLSKMVAGAGQPK